MTNILLVEDDRSIVANLTDYLQKEGYEVEAVSGQKAALAKVSERPFDLVLLDITLADGNGFAVCAAIKASYDLPVIFLTASGDEYSTVAGFEIGADDYVAKPFRPRELLSRIKNVLRRFEKVEQTVTLEDVTIDLNKGLVTKGGKEVFLSALEYRLLLVFLNNRGIVMSRNKLLEEIWDIAGEFVNDNTLTVYIKRLRDKIETDPQNPSIIKTIRGQGYRVDADGC